MVSTVWKSKSGGGDYSYFTHTSFSMEVTSEQRSEQSKVNIDVLRKDIPSREINKLK